jgi:hypothetical protein
MKEKWGPQLHEYQCNRGASNNTRGSQPVFCSFVVSGGKFVQMF